LLDILIFSPASMVSSPDLPNLDFTHTITS
jgi:hypothetical protein